VGGGWQGWGFSSLSAVGASLEHPGQADGGECEWGGLGGELSNVGRQ